MRARWREASPFEVVLLAVSVLCGLIVLVGTEIPPSLAATLSPTAQVVWAVGLLSGGGIALFGLGYYQPVDARLLEVLGLCLVAGTVLTYAVALIVVQGQIAVVTASLATAYGVACTWRVVQLWRAVRTVVRGVQDR